MIDFVKIRYKNPDIQKIRENPRLDWEQTIRERTGEVKEYNAIYNGLTFSVINNQYLNISGSLHKYWNSSQGGGEHNYNDFSLSNLAGVIMELCQSFDLLPENCHLENLEFGVNITPRVPVKDILRSAINHKGKPFTQEYLKNKYFRECERQRYIIKIYDKGLQYGRPENILRFENKIIKMAHIQETGVQTLADLLDPAKLTRLGVILGSNFNDILFYDYTIPKDRERPLMTQGQTPAFWLNLLETNPNNYYKKRDRFKQLVKKNGTQDFQEIVGCLVTQKWYKLLTSTPEVLQKLTGGAKQDFTEINHSDKGLKPVIFEPPPWTQEPGAEAPGNEPGRRYCLTCGRDISNQRPTSKFCSAKYVGYREAHRCRNTDSNPRNRAKYIIQKERKVLTLFDTLPYFVNKNNSKLFTLDKV
ncbi:MAG TPA: hypothetical protein PLR01_07235 [Bacteroidales bacterium]|nr:hypothetical protein [Bacteroidales bacterium]